MLAPHGVEQQTMLHAVFAEKKLTDVPAYHALLKLFTTLEVIRWPVLQSSYGAEMAAQTDVFGGAAAAKRMEDLNQRVVEHNILVIRKYYRWALFLASKLHTPHSSACGDAACNFASNTTSQGFVR